MRKIVSRIHEPFNRPRHLEYRTLGRVMLATLGKGADFPCSNAMSGPERISK